MTYRTHRIAAVVAIASLGLCAGFDCAAESAEPAAKTKKQIARFTADALVSLKRSADFLAGQKSYSFGADLSYDVLQPNGQLLEFGGTRDVLMRRPDRLRVEAVDRDGDVMKLLFDGQSILVDMPAEDA